MSIGLAFLVSSDPETSQHFSHALQELSIFPDVCREAPAIRLLNQRKFDAVIVVFQLGAQSGLVLDELKPGEQVKVQFTLPGHEAPSLAEAKICWRKTGRLGVCFDSLPQESKSDLQVSRSRRLEEMLPSFVADKFKDADGT